MMQESEEQNACFAEALMFFVVQAEHRSWWRCQSRRDKNEYQTVAIICLSAADRTDTHVTSVIHSFLYTTFSFICCWLVVEFSFSCVYLLNLSWMSLFLSLRFYSICFLLFLQSHFFSVYQYLLLVFSFSLYLPF